MPSTDTGVVVVAKSGNSKMGAVAATYVSQASCAIGCAYRGDGCYAELGRVAFTTRRVNAAQSDRPDVLARIEARGIDDLPADRPLRVHVVGDCRTEASARIVGAAMTRYDARSTGGKAWTYTHAWRTVARASWGSASVLASCESAADVADASARGYATARVVPAFSSDKRTPEGIPCPEQTRGITCRDCGLCQRADSLPAPILFAAHGPRALNVRASLS